MGTAEFFIFLLLFYSKMEMKSIQSLLNARGQGHLVTLAKVTLIKNFGKSFGVRSLKKNKAKWKCISYEAKMGWTKSNDSQIVKVTWPR